ncbi:hypothetical protein DH86_00003603 [Scytalidium sp. 3C]|nr:hypothetical protein DH86_00003603 [Scytalidium sp. 3C]
MANFLVKYHGNGVRSNYVNAEYTEIKETLAMENQWAQETKWIDIINTKGNRKRLFIAICVGTFSQTLGANLISTYLPVVLDGIGYTSSKTKLLINGLETLWVTLFCAAGGLISPYIKRRTHFLVGTAGLLAAFLAWTVASESYSKKTKGPSLEEIAIVFDGEAALVGSTGKVLANQEEVKGDKDNAARHAENIEVIHTDV